VDCDGASHFIGALPQKTPDTYPHLTMDVSGLLTSTSKTRSTDVHKEVPLVADAGLLAVFDTNDVEETSYR
jgi:hypothetical protein